MSGVAHFFVVVGGSKIHERLAHFFIDIYNQLYQAYAESHESDPAEISDGFKELEEFLHALPLEDNNAVFNLCCRLCCTYERKAFIDGLQYGAHLMSEL